MEEIDTQQILNDLTKVEEAADDVLRAKQEIIDLNVRINKNREALSAMKRDQHCSKDVSIGDNDAKPAASL